jgi:hypothetical protein
MGKFSFLNKIPQQRALIYLFILAMLPTFFALFMIWNGLGAVDSLQDQLHLLKEKNLLFEQRQAQNQQLMRFYQGSDHFYIDKHLETLSFLEPEIRDIQKIVKQKNYPDDEVLKKRLEFLTGENNDLVFSEGVVQNYGDFQETLETQVRPIQVNIDDLKKILSLIEGIPMNGEKLPPNRPQLIIIDFKLDKKGVRPGTDAFVLNMKLIKREFIEKG